MALFPSEVGLAPLAILCAAALLAGLIDAVVGGGGLIQLPALFAVFPNLQAATLFGSNKLASIWGTSAAAARYACSGRVEWAVALSGAVPAAAFAFLGAYIVTLMPGNAVRRSLPFILLAVAVYIFRKKDFGTTHTPLHTGLRQTAIGAAIGGAIGFYDGFFGPGTGSFLIFVYVRVFGFDFLRASAAAKIVNVACNFAALLWFGISGHVLVALGLTMAAFNLAGALIGSWLALRHGSAFVRKLFLVVVSALICKTTYDSFLR